MRKLDLEMLHGWFTTLLSHHCSKFHVSAGYTPVSLSEMCPLLKQKPVECFYPHPDKLLGLKQTSMSTAGTCSKAKYLNTVWRIATFTRSATKREECPAAFVGSHGHPPRSAIHLFFNQFPVCAVMLQHAFTFHYTSTYRSF